jgi:hypothetical protein
VCLIFGVGGRGKPYNVSITFNKNLIVNSSIKYLSIPVIYPVTRVDY